MTTQRIEDYAVIGDLHTAAIVGNDGSIDWLCLPHFDSPSCFTRLLGNDEHGFWQLAPAGGASAIVAVRRSYRHDSLVLETEFDTDGGTVRGKIAQRAAIEPGAVQRVPAPALPAPSSQLPAERIPCF